MNFDYLSLQVLPVSGNTSQQYMRIERKVPQVQKQILPWVLEDHGMKYQSKFF